MFPNLLDAQMLSNRLQMHWQESDAFMVIVQGELDKRRALLDSDPYVHYLETIVVTDLAPFRSFTGQYPSNPDSVGYKRADAPQGNTKPVDIPPTPPELVN